MEDRQENRYCIACEEVDNDPSANEQPQRPALAEISLGTLVLLFVIM